jgi:hypothetical protein
MFKRKHKNTPLKPPKNLWLKKSFDFVVPASLEDYCNHMEESSQGFFSRYDRVYFSSIDQKQISFTIYKSAGRSGTVWAVGLLQSHEFKSTRIVGKAGTSPADILVSVCIIGIIGFIFGFNEYLSHNLGRVYLIGFVLAIIILITLASLIWTRENLIDELKWVATTK